MTVGDKEYEEIRIVDNQNNVLASITDENVIEEDSCRIVFVPVQGY